MIYLKTKPTDLKELLTILYDGTPEGNLLKSGAATYFDERCTFEQCDINRYRSFEDIMELATTYFPETTIKDLVSALVTTTIIKDKTYYGYFVVCGTIRRITFSFYHSRNDVTGDHKFSGLKYTSKYSWPELLAMIGITDRESFLQYKQDHDIS